MQKKSNNEIISKLITSISLIFLFTGIILIYIFSILKVLYIWVDYQTVAGPSGIINREVIISYFNYISYNQSFRYNFIFLIIGIFLTSLILLLLNNVFIKKEDEKMNINTIIIHDDVIQIKLEKTEIKNGIVKTNPNKIFEESHKFYTIDYLFRRKNGIKWILFLFNILALLSIFGIVYVFFRGSKLAPESIRYYGYIYTDEAQIIIDVSMNILLLFFTFRCPDFVKSLSSTGFKRIYLKKFHIHESFIGILLTMGGIFLIINGSGGGAYFERMTGLVVIILGVFMLGRDWKDFTLGKFLQD